MDLSTLNPEQREAVKAISHPLLVLAGAGSGKTRVITTKIAHLINQHGYQARSIFAVTFTNKAAREMKLRVGKLLGSHKAKGLNVSTFHTLGLNMIRMELATLGLKSGFTIFDDKDTEALIRELAFAGERTSKEDMQRVTGQISKWKNDLVTPEKALKIAEPNQQTTAVIYEAYNRNLRAYNAVDFDDLILLPTLMLEDAEIKERWQRRVRYMLVDEYQDTNTAQYRLVKQLTGALGALTVVGDDDQSIYSWRGANPENLSLLKTDFPRLKVIKLEQNYRSSKRILHAANKLIANNPHEFTKKLWSDLPIGEPIRIYQVENEEAEAERVVAELIAHRFRNRTHYKDYAILYRGNFQSRLIEKTLIAHKIPYRLSGGTSFFGRAEIKDIMAYLRLLVNEDDDNAFIRIANLPKREIGPTTLEKLGTYAQRRQISLLEASFEMGIETVLTGKSLCALRAFTRYIVEVADNAKRGDTMGVLRDMLSTIKYQQYLDENNNSPKAAEFKYNNVMELFKWLEELIEGDEDSKGLSLVDAVTRLSLRDMMERQAEEETGDEVHLLTLHASKGLEYPYVYLIGAEEDILPHKSSIEEEKVEEERRLAYVGITRAQKELTITYTAHRSQYGEKINSVYSRFLDELPCDSIDWKKPGEEDSKEERQLKGKAHLQLLKGMLNKEENNR